MAEFDPDEAMVGAAMAAPPTTPPDIDLSLFGRPLTKDDAEPEQAQADEPAPDLKPQEFDPRHRQAFTGLLYLGALTTEVSLWGHRFVLATPTQTERLQIGPVIQAYVNTLTGEIAYGTAMVAAYLVSVDGQALPQPVLTNPKETALHDRFRWVTDNLLRPVIDYLYSECMKLEASVDAVLEAMGKA